MTSASDPKAIAGRLTPAQRAALLKMPIPDSRGAGVPSSTLALLCVGHKGIVSGHRLPPLVRRIHVTMYHKRYELTPLGEAVRAHLIGDPPHDQ